MATWVANALYFWFIKSFRYVDYFIVRFMAASVDLEIYF